MLYPCLGTIHLKILTLLVFTRVCDTFPPGYRGKPRIPAPGRPYATSLPITEARQSLSTNAGSTVTIYISFSILIKSSLFAHYKSSKKQEKRNHNFNNKNNSSIETELDKSTSSKIQQNSSYTIEKNQNECFC